MLEGEKEKREKSRFTFQPPRREPASQDPERTTLLHRAGTAGHPRRLIHAPRGPAYKTAPEFGGVRDHVGRAIRISRE